VASLAAFWAHTPPAALQLKRIALFIGLAPAKPVAEAMGANNPDALRQLMAAGLPVMEGRPDDPMLDLLDL
jgi:hypothetical protein